MIVPDIVQNKWNSEPSTIDIIREGHTQLEKELQTQLQTIRTDLEEQKQKVLELEGERYEQNKKIELLKMSHAALIGRLEALENM